MRYTIPWTPPAVGLFPAEMEEPDKGTQINSPGSKFRHSPVSCTLFCGLHY